MEVDFVVEEFVVVEPDPSLGVVVVEDVFVRVSELAGGGLFTMTGAGSGAPGS